MAQRRGSLQHGGALAASPVGSPHAQPGYPGPGHDRRLSSAAADAALVAEVALSQAQADAVEMVPDFVLEQVASTACKERGGRRRSGDMHAMAAFYAQQAASSTASPASAPPPASYMAQRRGSLQHGGALAASPVGSPHAQLGSSELSCDRPRPSASEDAALMAAEVATQAGEAASRIMSLRRQCDALVAAEAAIQDTLAGYAALSRSASQPTRRPPEAQVSADQHHAVAAVGSPRSHRSRPLLNCWSREQPAGKRGPFSTPILSAILQQMQREYAPSGAPASHFGSVATSEVG